MSATGRPLPNDDLAWERLRLSHELALRLAEAVIKCPGTDHVEADERRMTLEEWYDIQDLASEFQRAAGVEP